MSISDKIVENNQQKTANPDIHTNVSNYLPPIGRLKIFGNGFNNWSVATTGPFYFNDIENGANSKSQIDSSDPPLTGATNLINHFGLLSTYHKFCGKPLKTSLSSFLPNIAGNVDVHASENQSGLMSLLQKPPIQKEINTIPSKTMNEVFMLYPDPMPSLQHLFTQETSSINNSVLNIQSMSGALGSSKFVNKVAPSAQESSQGHSRKRKRRSSILLQPNAISNTTASAHDTTSNDQPSFVSGNLMRQSLSSLSNQPASAGHLHSTSISSAPLQASIPTHSPSIPTVIVKPKKTKKYDDEERKRRKKEKKEKKKKKDRSIE